MPEIKVSFSDTRLRDYADKIAALGTQGDLELARGLNDGGKVVLTNVRRALKAQMGVLKYSIIGAVTDFIPAVPGRDNALRFSITASGKGLPIKDFPVSASPGSSVTASPWGVSRTFERSFMTAKKHLLLARSLETHQTRRLYGPAPYKELTKPGSETVKTFERAVPAIVEPIIVRRLARLMP